MTTIAEALAAEDLTRHGGTCSVGTLLASLTTTDRQAINTALAGIITGATTYARVSRALRSAGHPIAQGTLSRHHHGECSCSR